MCFSAFLLWKQLMQIVGRTWLNLVTWTCGSWSEGQHDLYFVVQWFCLMSWRLFDVCTSYFGSMNQYDPTFDLKINVGHCDLYSMVQWFCLISWRPFDVWTLLFGILSQYAVWPKVWPQNKYMLVWPYFMVQWFCLIPWRLFDVCTSYFGNMNRYDQTYDLKINVDYCDLYSMVQWFCLISWKTIWWMNSIIRDYESVWPKILPQNKYRSLWSIFYGPVILCYILKAIWRMNIILRD